MPVGGPALRLVISATALLLLAAAPSGWAARACFSPSEASAHAEKEICLSAHVYQLNEGRDGTRILDVCPPGEQADGTGAACRFSIVSLPADRPEVGDLANYLGQDIHVRGTVHALHGESVMLLSHGRQFHDGPEKFRPNPALLAGFGAENGKAPVKDPASTNRRGKSQSAFLGTAH